MNPPPLPFPQHPKNRHSQKWRTIPRFALALLSITHLSAQTVDIPDPILLAAVRSNLNKPTGEITRADMEAITELTAISHEGTPPASRPTITTLTGLQAATNLEMLTLSAAVDDDTDLSPLQDLHSLTYLDLSSNSLTELTVPSGLIKLSALCLEDNQLTRLSIPPGAASLTGLELIWSTAREFEITEAPPGLRRLDLSSNHLTALTLPPSLNNLTHLTLNRNDLTHVPFLATLTNLTHLDLRNNQLAALDLPDNMATLEILSLTGNAMRSLSVPDSMPQLTHFYYLEGNHLPSTKISSIAIVDRTPGSLVMKVEWVAVPGAGYQLEVSQDLLPVRFGKWQEPGQRQSDSGSWLGGDGSDRQTRFVPTSAHAYLTVELPGEWKNGFVRIRPVDPIRGGFDP